MTGPIVQADIGDRVYLGSFLSQNHVHGVVSDLDSPDQASMSWEIAGGKGYLTVPVLQGRPGAQGTNAPLPRLQLNVFDDPDDLPTNLTDDDVDIGKYWIVREFDEEGDPVGSKAYIWYGDHYEWFQMGTQGPAGPVPIITFSIELLDPDDDDLENEVVVTGDSHHPSVLLKIKAPRGPQGVMGDMEDLTNWDGSTPAEEGDVPVFDGTNWKPSQAALYIPRFYTYPEGSFNDVPLAFGTRVNIGTALIPPQDYDCVPQVFGHFRVTGVEFDTTPLMIGVEVRLGSVSGTLVARGWGNITNYVTVIPHASAGGSAANDAITPTNGRAVVAAGATGSAATLYVNCFNDGVAGIYNFENAGAQLSVTLMPIP